MPATLLQTADVPTEPAWLVWLAWGVVPLTAVMLGLLAATGVLSLRRLAKAPKRDTGLTLLDAFIGVWLLLLGKLLASAAVGALVSVQSNTAGSPAEVVEPVFTLSPALIYVNQFCSFGPAIAWWLYRLARPMPAFLAMMAGPASSVSMPIAPSPKPGPLRPRFREAGLIPRSLAVDLRWTLLGLPALVLLFMATQQVAALISTLLGYKPPTVQHDLLLLYADLRDRGELLTIVGLLLSTVVFAPFLEELLFRGFLQSSLVSAFGPSRASRRWLAIAAVSGLFAVLHMGAVPPVALPALFVLGLCFGFVYERTGSLWPPMLIHAGFNAINVAYVLALA